jgi:hypothetical protein
MKSAALASTALLMPSVLIASLLLLAACGSSSDSAPADTTPTATTAATSAATETGGGNMAAPDTGVANTGGASTAATTAGTAAADAGTPVNLNADTPLGAGANGVIGDKLASILSGDDRQTAATAAAQAASLANGQKVTWQGSTNATDAPATGWALPVGAPYKDTAGRSCRFVEQSASHGSDSASDTLKICNGGSGWVPA